MYILCKKWKNNYLDYPRTAGRVRIEVCAWAVLKKISDMFIEHPKSYNLLYNYICEFGLYTTINKVRSRYAERFRNNRYLSVGLGRILESDHSNLPINATVFFVAPSHPRCVQRLVLTPELIFLVDKNIFPFYSVNTIFWADFTEHKIDSELCGWQPESGVTLPLEDIYTLFDKCMNFFTNEKIHYFNKFQFNRDIQISEAAKFYKNKINTKKTACLFGFGNYAKTVIIPNISSEINLTCVHECDPTQLGPIESHKYATDTSPSLRKDECYDINFIAGYHHTHADLAISTLENNSYAVVEKPAVTTYEQLNRLTNVIQKHTNKLFVCFHMRYNPLIQNIWNDLDVTLGEPINYYCTIFEIPLPTLHWYRWPNSGSHIISNGCHWIDHFLFINSYSIPVKWNVIPCANGDTQVHIELNNGAVMGMHLTHTGSSRLGVRDHVEMRAKNRTAILESGASYKAESSTKIIIKRNGNRMDAYKKMYRSISEKIIKNLDADSLNSIVITHKLILDLNAMYQERKAKYNL